MTTRLASCSCGQLQLKCDGEPVRISICHCLECQKRTGSAFGIQARYKRENVLINGSANQFSRVGDSGGKATFGFCPKCAATVYWEPEDFADFIIIAIGAFMDPNFPAPTISVYDSRRHPWVDLSKLNLEIWD